MGKRTFDFVQVDVFTTNPLEGNQLAVFTDARGLTDIEMQQLARETNLSETTFVLPRDPEVEEREGHRVRIFTVNEELPFAGHPTLGTAWHLHRQFSRDEVLLHLNVGKVPVLFEQREGHLFGEMRQIDPHFGPMHKHAEVAAVLGLPVAALDENVPIQTVSTGMRFTMVPFRSLAALRSLKVSWNQMSGYLARLPQPSFFYLVCRETENPAATLHARMIFYNGEDPATGSAAGCCVAWAVKHNILGSDEQGIIEQGIEVKRPSFLYVRASSHNGTIGNVRVGGHVVQVIEGRAHL
jgi:trans-2,3-dihydro-3-hydroxyanthranilate isomerase